MTALSGHRIVQAACSYHHSLCLSAEGTLFAFGRNDSGQLGTGDTNDCRLPTEVLGIPRQVDALSCGQFHRSSFPFRSRLLPNSSSALVSSAGDLWVTGKNEYGQLGLEGVDSAKTFTRVVLPADRVVKACCGYYHTLVLTSSGRVYAAGRNDYGQLGLGHSQTRVFGLTEVVALRDRSIADVSAGCYHSCAVTVHGMLYLFGRNNHGQLGTGDADERHLPHPVDSFLGRRVVKVACGFYHTLVLSTRAEDLSSRAKQLDSPLKLMERRPRRQSDLIAFLVGELDRIVRSEGSRMQSGEESERLLRYLLSSAALILGLALERIIRPNDGPSLMLALSLEETSEFLTRTLCTVDNLLSRAASMLIFAEQLPAEDLTIEQHSSLEQTYSSRVVEACLQVFSGEGSLFRAFSRLRRLVLLAFNLAYPDVDLVADALDAAQCCLTRHSDLMFPSEAERAELLTSLSVYVVHSVKDSVMLANGECYIISCSGTDVQRLGNKRAHLCRCVSLFSRLAAQFFQSSFPQTSMRHDIEPGFKVFSETCVVITEVYRILRTSALRQYFGSLQVSDLRMTLSLLEHCGGGLAKALFPLVLNPDIDVNISENTVRSIIESVFCCVDEIVTLIMTDTNVPDEIGNNFVYPLLTSVVPAILLHSMNSSDSCGLLFPVSCHAEKLANRLLLLRRTKAAEADDPKEPSLEWVDRVARLCVAAGTRGFAGTLRRTDCTGFLDEVPRMELWRFFDRPEDLQATASAVDQGWLLSASTDCMLLRASHAKTDGSYRLLHAALDRSSLGGTVRQVESILWRALCSALSRTSFAARGQEWDAVARFTSQLFLKRHRVESSWADALSTILKLSDFGLRFIEALVPRRSVFPLPEILRVHRRLKSVLRCVLCALRWQRLLRYPRQTFATAVLEPFYIFSEMALTKIENDSVCDFDEVCLAFLRRLQFTQDLSSRRVAALRALADCLTGPLFEINPFAVFEAAVNARLPSDAFLCCANALRVAAVEASERLFAEGLVESAAKLSQRLIDLGASSLSDLKLVLAAYKAIIVHAPSISSAADAVTTASQRLLLKLFDLDCPTKESQSRTALREVGRTAKALSYTATSALIQLAVSCPSWSTYLPRMQGAVLSLLPPLLQGQSTLESRHQASILSCDDPPRFLSDDIRVGQRKRSQEIIAQPRQFLRNQEGLVVQGDRLYTNFKGIDFTLSFWLFLGKKPPGKYSFVAGKLSHADAWPVILVRCDLKIEVVYGKGNDFERLVSKRALTLNTWIHVCVVTEPRKMKLYLRGALDASTTTSGNTRANLYPLVIGNCPVSVRTRVEYVHEGFDGLIGSFNYHVRISIARRHF